MQIMNFKKILENFDHFLFYKNYTSRGKIFESNSEYCF